MAQYIDKATIVAEIEKRLNYRNKELDAINNGTFWDEEQSEDTFNVSLTKCAYNAVKNELFELKCFLDIVETIEVKEENDLENLFQALPEKIADEKSHHVYELSIYHYDGQCVVDYVGEINHDSLYSFGGNTLYEAIEKAWNWLYKNSTGG